MSRLPNLTARQIVKALKKSGFEEIRQKGSHIYFHNFETRHTTVVPMHTGDVNRPLFKNILKQAGLTEDEFRMLL